MVASAWRAGHTSAPSANDLHPESVPAPTSVEQRRGILGKIDIFQQQHEPLAFLVGVGRKFGDDRAGQRAALIAYYGFFSLFPLLLVLVTVLGFAIQGDPQLQRRLLGSALAQFPIIGAQIERNVRSLTGSGLVLAGGLVGAIWSGLGVTGAIQDAMDEIWNVVEQLGSVMGAVVAVVALVQARRARELAERANALPAGD